MNRIGETNINSKGERFAISNYINANNVDVIFEIDNSSKRTTYAQVKSGHVSRINTEDVSYWIGETVEDSSGEECQIVEMDSNENVTVQYKDGEIVSELPLKNVMVGAFDRERKIFSCETHTIEEERRNTYENVVYLVNRFRRCVMIRPCGFGKTKIGLKLFSSPRYRKCLFLHPASDDENAWIVENSQSKKRIDTRTYAWLRSRTPEQIKNLDYDLVFCDEVHCIGGNDEGDGAYKTYKAMKLFMESHPQTHFIGATATPLRMDGINVISTMFHNHTCYPYTDEDAFEDGVLKKPHYYYCVYDVLKRLKDEVEKNIHAEMDRDELQKTLKLTGEDIDEIDTKYMDKHIRRSCNKVLTDTSYMRFIAFYLTNEEIRSNKEKVLNWFKNAYPEYEIYSITVTNRTHKSLKDVDKLPTKPSDPKYKGRIDIIFNCEKLCMGYHSELITGLILDRKTQSLAKYIQMIGRLLSCDNDNPVIIFDVVDNIHSDFVCKTPQVVETGMVAPKFEKEPTTFAEIVATYPNARHWDEIKRTNKKAKKAEKILFINEKESHPDNTPVINDVAAKPFFNRATKAEIAEAKETIQNAWDTVRDTHMTFAQAVNYLSGIQDEYGTVDPHENEYEQKEVSTPPVPHTVFCKPSIPSVEVENTTNHTDKLLKVESTEVDTEGLDVKEIKKDNIPASAAEKDPLGYQPTYYYDMNTQALYSRNVAVLNKRSNFEEDIKAAIQAVTKAKLDTIIKKWHTYPTCEENYKDYTEIDKKSAKYKFLKSCSEFIFSTPVESTLIYMIEGKIT